MSNEEFQKLVVEKLGSIETKIDSLDTRMTSLESKVDSLDTRVASMETKFKTQINQNIDDFIESRASIYEMLGEHDASIRSIKRTLRQDAI